MSQPPHLITFRVAEALIASANLTTWECALAAIKAQQDAMEELGFEMQIVPKRDDGHQPRT